MGMPNLSGMSAAKDYTRVCTNCGASRLLPKEIAEAKAGEGTQCDIRAEALSGRHTLAFGGVEESANLFRRRDPHRSLGFASAGERNASGGI